VPCTPSPRKTSRATSAHYQADIGGFAVMPKPNVREPATVDAGRGFVDVPSGDSQVVRATGRAEIGVPAAGGGFRMLTVAWSVVRLSAYD